MITWLDPFATSLDYDAEPLRQRQLHRELIDDKLHLELVFDCPYTLEEVHRNNIL